MGNFGRDRILTLQCELLDDGIRASIRKICDVLGFNRKKIHRIVKEHCWQRWKHAYGNRPRVKGMKSVTPQANSRWAIDMTHLFTKQEGWCHLVAVIDCSDRFLVGWRFSRSGKAGISAGALEDALIREKIFPNVHGLVIRSDNGLVFGSKRFHETVTKYHLHQEYITPYTPEQNGMIERFFRASRKNVRGSIIS